VLLVSGFVHPFRVVPAVDLLRSDADLLPAVVEQPLGQRGVCPAEVGSMRSRRTALSSSGASEAVPFPLTPRYGGSFVETSKATPSSLRRKRTMSASAPVAHSNAPSR
jgi:hypothetical protein